MNEMTGMTPRFFEYQLFCFASFWPPKKFGQIRPCEKDPSCPFLPPFPRMTTENGGVLGENVSK
jgi:hypothetical protein